MNSKEFIKTETVQRNGLLIAEQIYKDGFVPTVIFVILRGGALLGNVISEYFKLSTSSSSPPIYAAVVAHSYVGTSAQEEIIIEGWTFSPERIRKHDKIIFIDDIFDSGKTINKLVSVLIENGATRENIKMVVHDYKIREFVKTKLEFFPDYYARKLQLADPSQDNWIHYLSHEIDGLSKEEINMYYDESVRPILFDLIKRHSEKDA